MNNKLTKLIQRITFYKHYQLRDVASSASLYLGTLSLYISTLPVAYGQALGGGSANNQAWQKFVDLFDFIKEGLLYFAGASGVCMLVAVGIMWQLGSDRAPDWMKKVITGTAITTVLPAIFVAGFEMLKG